MAPSRLLWHLQNESGHHALCYVSPQDDNQFLLLITKAGTVMVAEEHQGIEPATARAATVYAELVEDGWQVMSAEAT